MAVALDERRIVRDVRKRLSPGRASREELIEAAQYLQTIERELDMRVRALRNRHAGTQPAKRAHNAFLTMKRALHWVEANRYSAFQSDLHRQTTLAQESAEEVLNILSSPGVRIRGRLSQVVFGRGRWDGIERRSGMDRRHEMGPGPKTSVPFEQRSGRDRRRAR